MNKNTHFESGRLLYRGIREQDADCLVKWRSDPEVIRYYSSPTPVTVQSHHHWYFNTYLHDNSRFDFIITEKVSGADIGFVSIKDMDLLTMSGEISYTIAERDAQRKGYAREAILALLETLPQHITTVYAVVHRDNAASIRTIAKLGFVPVDRQERTPFLRYKKEICPGGTLCTIPNIVIATTHPWNIRKAKTIQASLPDYRVHIVTEKQALTREWLETLQPSYVFFPHWSWIIPASIYESFPCVVFHMTDLPFGRGGSPLQNLISHGITETRISAIQVTQEIDAGSVYLKVPMNLYGGAEEIYMRASNIIFDQMIPTILRERPVPVPQTGPPIHFTRRTPAMSELSPQMTLEQLFDHIRMLDAQGYPPAFLRFGPYTLEFSRPKKTFDGILADVMIREVDDHDDE